MTDKDKKDIADLINSSKTPVIDKNITEWLFRALIGLLLFLGNNIRVEQENQGNDLQEVKSSISKMQTENQYYYKDVEGFRQVLAKPRFTKEDFDLGITPILKQINANTNELNTRNNFMSETEKRLTKLEYQIVELIEFKKN